MWKHYVLFILAPAGVFGGPFLKISYNWHAIELKKKYGKKLLEIGSNLLNPWQNWPVIELNENNWGKNWLSIELKEKNYDKNWHIIELNEKNWGKNWLSIELKKKKYDKNWLEIELNLKNPEQTTLLHSNSLFFCQNTIEVILPSRFLMYEKGNN